MKLLDSKTYKTLSKEKQNAYLIEYLNYHIELSQREQQSKENYSLPAWPYLQAGYNEKQKILRKILTIIS